MEANPEAYAAMSQAERKRLLRRARRQREERRDDMFDDMDRLLRQRECCLVRALSGADVKEEARIWLEMDRVLCPELYDPAAPPPPPLCADFEELSDQGTGAKEGASPADAAAGARVSVGDRGWLGGVFRRTSEPPSAAASAAVQPEALEDAGGDREDEKPRDREGGGTAGEAKEVEAGRPDAPPSGLGARTIFSPASAPGRVYLPPPIPVGGEATLVLMERPTWECPYDQRDLLELYTANMAEVR